MFRFDGYFYKTIKGTAMGTKSACLQYFSNWIFEEILYLKVETELQKKLSRHYDFKKPINDFNKYFYKTTDTHQFPSFKPCRPRHTKEISFTINQEEFAPLLVKKKNQNIKD